MRADAPAEVGTIIWLPRKEVKAGAYAGGGDATVHIWYVSVIDPAGPTLVEEATFRGTEPPWQISCPEGSQCGASGD